VSFKEWLGPRYEPRATGILAAGSHGTFQVLATGNAAVQEFDRTGQPTRTFGAALAGDTSAGGWIRRLGDVVYHRRSGTLTFDLHGSDGRLLQTIVPAGIPFHPRSDTNVPGDAVFGVDVLPDGRIVAEVAHRTPY